MAGAASAKARAATMRIMGHPPQGCGNHNPGGGCTAARALWKMGNSNETIMNRLLALLALATLSGFACAQVFPGKPLRIVVPFAAGGAVDTIARAFSPKLTEGFAQPVIVENRPGAGSNIGADVVAKSAPDGSTVLLTPAGLAIGPSLYRKLPFDPAKDLVPVSQLMSSWLILVTTAKLPASSVRELLALAKSKPGRLNYGSTGIGSPPHLAGELLRLRGGIDIVHVPYKGDAPMYAALLAGEVDLGFGPLAGALPHIRAGRLDLLAITAPPRPPPHPGGPPAPARDHRCAALAAAPRSADAGRVGAPRFPLLGLDRRAGAG